MTAFFRQRSNRFALGAVTALALTAGAAFITSDRQALAETALSATLAYETTKFRTMEIDGLSIAYREAGDPSRPTILLLHGFPTSSHMFRELIPILAQRYHVLAPDYPGYGASDQPSVDEFEYTFAHTAEMMDTFVQNKGVKKYTIYLMDYGAPVGFRLFAKHPERVTGMVIQNGNAYEEGLKAFWDPIKKYWAEPSKENGDALRHLLTLEATEWQYTHGIPKEALALVSPDNWHHDQYLLDRDGNQDIQIAMFLSYGTNIPEYAKWQALFRKHQPPAIILWGQGDHIFPPDGAYPYQRDLKDVELHLLDTGHFALETHLSFISEKILTFMDRTAQ